MPRYAPPETAAREILKKLGKGAAVAAEAA